MDTTARENKIFRFNKLRIFFKHTDYHGFVHPYNFYEWTSYVREAFFSELCGDFNKILNSPVKMMTAKITLEIFDDSKFGDFIEARFTTSKIKKVSFDVMVDFFNIRMNKVVCQTGHTLVFVDADTQKFTNIPEGIRDAVVQYQR